MNTEKIKTTKKMRPFTVFCYSVIWTAICLSLIAVGLVAAKIIFG